MIPKYPKTRPFFFKDTIIKVKIFRKYIIKLKSLKAEKFCKFVKEKQRDQKPVPKRGISMTPYESFFIKVAEIINPGTNQKAISRLIEVRGKSFIGYLIGQ